MDGFETASLIRERPRSEKTPIIFLTAVSEPRPRIARGYSLGAVDYIQLPVAARGAAGQGRGVRRALPEARAGPRAGGAAAAARGARAHPAPRRGRRPARLRDAAQPLLHAGRRTCWRSPASTAACCQLNPSWERSLGFAHDELLRGLGRRLPAPRRPRADARPAARARGGRARRALREPPPPRRRQLPLAVVDRRRLPGGGPRLRVRARRHLPRSSPRRTASQLVREQEARQAAEREQRAQGRVPGDAVARAARAAHADPGLGHDAAQRAGWTPRRASRARSR